MNHAHDQWKKYPLLVLGERVGCTDEIPNARYCASLEQALEQGEHINNFYILLILDAAPLREALLTLEGSGIGSEQLIVFWRAEKCFLHPSRPLLGVLDAFAGESREEFRLRLLGKLECQRQKRLATAVLAAEKEVAYRSLPPARVGRAIDCARIAHSIACSYGLPPQSHAAVLRACLIGTNFCPQPWPADSSLEYLIPEIAAIVLDSAIQSKNFRETLRERAALLPFRVRTDLIHHIEGSLGLLLGGKHVA